MEIDAGSGPLVALHSKLAPFGSPLRIEESFTHLQPWARSWFCISRRQLWTTRAHSCRGLAEPGCGSCLPSHYRKGNLFQMLLTFLQVGSPRPDLAACAAFNCQDSPRFPQSGQKRFTLSYSSSSMGAGAEEATWDVPFVDYRMPVQWPRWLSAMHNVTQALWHTRRDVGVLAFGNLAYAGPGFRQNTAVGKNHKLALRHAFYHGCTARNWSAQLEIVNGPRSARQWMPKSEYCSYRYVVLMSGNSNWLDSIKELLLCGSLLIFVVDMGTSMMAQSRRACDPIMQGLSNGSHYLRVEVDGGLADSSAEGRHRLCNRVSTAISWAQQHPAQARKIARQGREYVLRYWQLDGIHR